MDILAIGKIIKKKDMDHISIPTESDMRANGSKTKSMDKATTNTKMAIITREVGKMTTDTVMGKCTIIMGQNIVEDGKRENNMEEEPLLSLREIIIMESGKVGKCMEREF